MNDDELSQGTFACDICGLDKPHHHTEEEIEIERLIRPAFEKTTVPGGIFWRYGLRGPYRYVDPLWQHFIAGWYAAKKTFADTQGKPAGEGS